MSVSAHQDHDRFALDEDPDSDIPSKTENRQTSHPLSVMTCPEGDIYMVFAPDSWSSSSSALARLSGRE